ncbi:hypothetical protein GJ496_007853 [Pomphorhynchus laevis]|nr:hypothetical protein GJ496_007853 [Pomphorhynchus laevis]
MSTESQTKIQNISCSVMLTALLATTGRTQNVYIKKPASFRDGHTDECTQNNYEICNLINRRYHLSRSVFTPPYFAKPIEASEGINLTEDQDELIQLRLNFAANTPADKFVLAANLQRVASNKQAELDEALYNNLFVKGVLTPT